MSGQQLARLAHICIAGLGQPGRGTQHLGPHVECHQRETIVIGQRAQDGLRRRDLELPGGIVAARRGIHHHDDRARLFGGGREFQVWHIAPHHEVCALGPGRKAWNPSRRVERLDQSDTTRPCLSPLA